MKCQVFFGGAEVILEESREFRATAIFETVVPQLRVFGQSVTPHIRRNSGQQ